MRLLTIITLDVTRTDARVLRVRRSFRGKEAEAIAQGLAPKRVSKVLRMLIERKFQVLEAAVSLDDLRSPPGNRLESLKGDRAGQHSIRVNDQWRICFVWTEKGPEHFEIVDYH
jgi:toxin HigB-1